MYDWRKMSDLDRSNVLALRRSRKLPWHSPPHFEHDGTHRYLISAACYEHNHIIGQSSERLSECEEQLLRVCAGLCLSLYAWCILPNHYHALVRTDHIGKLLHELGQFHGRSSFRWNAEDDRLGRKVWYNCFERRIRSERHFWATLNYVHHNPVRHGYVGRWQDWPWSSAADFLKEQGRDIALKLWREYPILNYGKKWDR